MSGKTWAIVKRLKDETLGVVNNAVKALPETATGLELSKAILVHLGQAKENPYDIGLSHIRRELEELF